MLGKWSHVERLPSLSDKGLHLWRIDLPDEATPPEQFLHLLLPDEKERAERLRVGTSRLQFVVARAALRVLLGDCLGICPTDVPIAVTRFGKPETPGVFFNVAHSGATVLIALCRTHRVGIDVEYFSRDVEALAIARHSFSPQEQSELASIDDPEALRCSFFRCWARKEAIIKADGRGLSLPLDSFTVPVQERAHCVEVVLPEDRSYYLTDLYHSDGSAAAFAVSAPQCHADKFLLPLNYLVQKP